MKRIDYKYLVAAVYAVALFMSLLDTTIVNIALPTLSSAFHAGAKTIEWVITGYLLSLAVFIPVSGWAGDRFGTKRTFLFALAVFTAGSLLCSIASGIESLIAFRILQGVGGAMLTPVGAAMIYRAFPPDERARASSIIMVPAVVGSASGPIVGGYLLQAASWRAIFWINVPIGLLALALAAITLREQREGAPGRFDLAGFVLGAVGLSSILHALAQSGSHGFRDPGVVTFGLLGLTGLGTFVAVEMHVAEPMLDLRLFRNSLFRTGSGAQFFGFGAQFGALFLLPLWLQAERGLSPLESGLTTFPQAIGVMTMAPVAGRLYRHVGPRRMALFGLSLASVAMVAFVRVDLQTNEWWIRGLMLLRGWGFGLSLTALQTATFATVERASMGRGSAIYSVIRQVGTSLTVAMLATVLSASLLRHGAVLGVGDPRTKAAAVLAFHEAFFAAALVTVVAAALVLFVDDRLAAVTMRPAARPRSAGPETDGQGVGVVPLAEGGEA